MGKKIKTDDQKIYNIQHEYAKVAIEPETHPWWSIKSEDGTIIESKDKSEKVLQEQKIEKNCMQSSSNEKFDFRSLYSKKVLNDKSQTTKKLNDLKKEQKFTTDAKTKVTKIELIDDIDEQDLNNPYHPGLNYLCGVGPQELAELGISKPKYDTALYKSYKFMKRAELDDYLDRFKTQEQLISDGKKQKNMIGVFKSI